jgi:hypothetical protein
MTIPQDSGIGQLLSCRKGRGPWIARVKSRHHVEVHPAREAGRKRAISGWKPTQRKEIISLSNDKKLLKSTKIASNSMI